MGGKNESAIPKQTIHNVGLMMEVFTYWQNGTIQLSKLQEESVSEIWKCSYQAEKKLGLLVCVSIEVS